MRVEVNSTLFEVEPGDDEAAVDLIRERLGLTGTKLVCGAGVCGACTVLLDGTPVVSCLLPATSLAGRSLQTVEGLGDEHAHPVQRALVAEDGLQCGFCTPGFAVEAAAFHDGWRAEHGAVEPPVAAVEAALAGHLCRCGAYPGIVRAVRAACAGRFDTIEVVSGPRHEALAKVTGAARYTVDVRLEGQLEGLILRSTHAHARVLPLSLKPALRVVGARAAVDLLPSDRIVRYIGQEIAAVAAVDRRAAEQALAQLSVAYEAWPAAIGRAAARTRGAPAVYRAWRRRPPAAAEGPILPTAWKGNVRGPTSAFSTHKRAARRLLARAHDAGDPFLVEGVWRTEAQSHTSLEPHAAVASWDRGTLTVHASTQVVGQLAREIAKHFRLPKERVRVLAEHVGGGFGSKLELSFETVAAIELARTASAPVRVVLDRSDELTVGGYRPGTELELSLLGARNGMRALRFAAYADAGTAVGSTIAGLARVIYPAPAKELVDYDVVNHMPPGKPFRGPSGPLTCWALEQAVDEFAHRAEEDPIRLRQRWDPNPLRQQLYTWAGATDIWLGRPCTGAQTERFRRGVGVAAANWFYWWQPGCQVEVGVEDGHLWLATATQDIGTGTRSVLAGIIARAFDVDPDRIDVRIGDSRLPTGPVSGGSRATATLVPIADAAVQRLQQGVATAAASKLGLDQARCESRGVQHADGVVAWPEALAAAGTLRVNAERPADTSARAPKPYEGAGLAGVGFGWLVRLLTRLRTGYGYTGAVYIAEVEVDTRLGHVRATRVASGLAVGRIQARVLAESQVRGGVIQGVGYALTEQRHVDPSGRVLSLGLEDYRIPGIADTPEIEVHFHEAGFEHVAGGGVGLGEISTLPTAAAIGNAVFNATGWRPKELPIRTDRLLAGLADDN